MSGELMARYRTRPSFVEAIRWTGENLAEVRTFCARRVCDVTPRDDGSLFLSLFPDREGGYICDPGEWLIKGECEVYPMDAAFFESKYEPDEPSLKIENHEAGSPEDLGINLATP